MRSSRGTRSLVVNELVPVVVGGVRRTVVHPVYAGNSRADLPAASVLKIPVVYAALRKHAGELDEVAVMRHPVTAQTMAVTEGGLLAAFDPRMKNLLRGGSADAPLTWAQLARNAMVVSDNTCAHVLYLDLIADGTEVTDILGDLGMNGSQLGTGFAESLIAQAKKVNLINAADVAVALSTIYERAELNGDVAAIRMLQLMTNNLVSPRISKGAAGRTAQTKGGSTFEDVHDVGLVLGRRRADGTRGNPLVIVALTHEEGARADDVSLEIGRLTAGVVAEQDARSGSFVNALAAGGLVF